MFPPMYIFQRTRLRGLNKEEVYKCVGIQMLTNVIKTHKQYYNNKLKVVFLCVNP